MRRYLAGTGLLTGMVLTFVTVQLDAQGSRGRQRVSPEVGVRLGRDFSADHWTAGGHLSVPLAGTLELRPSADASLSDLTEDFQLNADLALRGARDQAYIGAGVARVNRDFDSGRKNGTGINLFLGLKPFPRPGARLYIEGRWTLVDDETIFRVGVGAALRL